MSDLNVFNAGFGNVFVCWALLLLFFVGKYLQFEEKKKKKKKKKIQVFIGEYWCNLKEHSEKKRNLKSKLKIKLKMQI